MGASFEIKTGLIRYGNDHLRHGDPYTGAAHVTCNGARVFVDAYVGNMMPGVVRDIRAALRQAFPHATEMVFVRKKDGHQREGKITMESKFQVRMQVVIDGKVRTELTQNFGDNIAEMVRYEKKIMQALGELGDETAAK